MLQNPVLTRNPENVRHILAANLAMHSGINPDIVDGKDLKLELRDGTVYMDFDLITSLLYSYQLENHIFDKEAFTDGDAI